jgi:nitrate reductase gamma subunit
MMPWEKESAAKHLPTYVAGMSYHAGIFSAILCALSLAASVRLGPALVLSLQVLMAAGFLAGTGLLIKRTMRPEIRHISCPDDYAANLITDILILCGLLAVRLEALETVFLLAAAVTFLYMPVGKIRHCFFFFYSRFLFGSYFGRRGVLPRRRPVKAEARP